MAEQKARVLKIRTAKAAATAAAAAARAQAAAAGQGTAQVRMGPKKSEIRVPGIVLARKRGAGLGPRRQLSLPAHERPWQKVG